MSFTRNVMFEIKDRGQKTLTWGGHTTKTLLLPSLTGSVCAAQFQLTALAVLRLKQMLSGELSRRNTFSFAIIRKFFILIFLKTP